METLAGSLRLPGERSPWPYGQHQNRGEVEIITDPQSWIDFLKARNITTHTYREYDAAKIYQKVKNFPPLVDQFISSTEKILAQ